MSLHAELDQYLHLRRMFGAKMKIDELRLRSFVIFVDQAGKTFVTRELILDWMKGLRPASSGTKASRFSAVREFAQWLREIDDRHEDPPPQGFVPGHVTRPAPYIFCDAEIAQIIRAARDLPSIYGIRGLTCACYMVWSRSRECVSEKPWTSILLTSTSSDSCCTSGAARMARSGSFQSIRASHSDWRITVTKWTGCLSAVRNRSS